MSATTTPDGGTAHGEQRWGRRPSAGWRLLGGVGPPVAVAASFLVAWNEVSSWPDAPTGDTNFAWMPMGAVAVGVGFGLAGLLALLVRTASRLLGASLALWVVPAAILFLNAFPADGFPASAHSLVAGWALASLAPTTVVAGWAAFGAIDEPQRAPVVPGAPGRPRR